MKKVLLVILLTFGYLFSAQAFQIKPCMLKEYFDNNPDIPPETEVGMIAGHLFRKKDACLPLIMGVKWSNHYWADPHSFYDLKYTHHFPGELWFRTDRQEYVIIANALNYSGEDRVSGFSAKGDGCSNWPAGGSCQMWTSYSYQHARLSPMPTPGAGPRHTTNFQLGYPTVTQHEEEVPQMFSLVAFDFKLEKGDDFYKPTPEIINNWSLNPLTYQLVVEAASDKQVLTKTVNYDHNNDTEDETPHSRGSVEMSFYFGCPKELKITKPSKNEKFVFSSDTEGIIEIEAEVAFENYPDVFLDDTHWLLPEKLGSEVIYKPNSRQGKKITLSYKKLPKFNRDFGVTTIEAQINLGGRCGKLKASRDIKIFYPRSAKNSPAAPSEPNWYYYWQQTTAGRGTVADQDISYKNRDGLCGAEPTFRGYFPIKIKTLCGQEYTWGYDYIYVCDFTKPQVNFQLMTATTGELLDGIDAFAVSVGHELLHMKHWKSWWNPRGGWPETGRFSVGSNDQCLSTPEPVDKDLDYIPDHLEAGLGYNKNDKFTHRQQYGTGEMWDEHHLTYKGAEVEWTAGQADSEDWSHPGHQWE